MSTSRVPALRSALKSVFAAQLVTDGVTATVTEFDPGDEQTKVDCVWFGSIRSQQAEHTFGGSRAESMIAEGFVRVMRPGAGDTVAAAAEDQAHVILASLEDALRSDITVGSAVFDCVIAGHESGYATDPEGRICVVAFDVEAEAHI